MPEHGNDGIEIENDVDGVPELDLGGVDDGNIPIYYSIPRAQNLNLVCLDLNFFKLV